MPGLDVVLAGAFFEVVELAGVVYPGSGGCHVVGKGDGVGADGEDSLWQIIIGGGYPVENEEVPADLHHDAVEGKIYGKDEFFH